MLKFFNMLRLRLKHAFILIKVCISLIASSLRKTNFKNLKNVKNAY